MLQRLASHRLSQCPVTPYSPTPKKYVFRNACTYIAECVTNDISDPGDTSSMNRLLEGNEKLNDSKESIEMCFAIDLFDCDNEYFHTKSQARLLELNVYLVQ